MTTQEWKKKLTDEWLKQPGVEVYRIDTDKTFDEQFSAVSIENLLFYAQAFGLMVLEKIVGDRIAKLEEHFNRLRPHTLSWYAGKIKAFQMGDTLPTDTDVYPNINKEKQVLLFLRSKRHFAPLSDGAKWRFDRKNSRTKGRQAEPSLR